MIELDGFQPYEYEWNGVLVKVIDARRRPDASISECRLVIMPDEKEIAQELVGLYPLP
jgi:hypothetical protein